MAPKGSSLLEDPPTASSSSGEEEEVSVEGKEQGGTEKHESDSDDFDKSLKKPTTENSTPKPQTSSSSSQDNNEPDSDDFVKSTKNPKLKITAATSKPKKMGVKLTASNTKSIPTKKPSAAKRKHGSEKAEKDSNKKKKIDDKGENNTGKGENKSIFDDSRRIPRVWSEDDEIILLKGMNEWLKKGIEPNSDLDEFLEYIQKSLNVSNISRDQLYNKIRRLKGKFMNNFKKRGESGEDPVFSKPHELKSYMIMKEIWGEKEVKKSDKKNNGNSKNGDSGANHNGNLKPATAPIDMLGLKESLSKESLKLIGDLKTKELEKKWKKLHAEEADIYLKRLDLVREQTMVLLNAIKSSDS